MAENKKSFLMYADWIYSIKHLTDEQAGKLLKHLLDYVNDKEPQTNDPIINITFEPIKQQLKRDLEKWDVIRGKRSEAGKKSAEKRAQQKLTSVESVEQDSTNPTVNDNDNVTVTVNDNVIKQKAFDVFWTKYPKKVEKKEVKEKFLKLKQTEIDIILSTIDNFLAYKPFKDYTHPNPKTYINKQRWTDEIGETTKTEFNKFKRLNLTEVGAIRSKCKVQALLEMYLKTYDCTRKEILDYITFREDNNYLNTYEV